MCNNYTHKQSFYMYVQLPMLVLVLVVVKDNKLFYPVTFPLGNSGTSLSHYPLTVMIIDSIVSNFGCCSN